uniref:N-acetylmuramoyl-L-alanine amidase family protein n=3 Tax=unclassified Clostridium TaxID=2614128 RepID=UPI000C17BD22
MKIRKLIAMAVVSTVISTIIPVAANAAWKTDSQNNWSWVENDNTATGWKLIQGTWYYFDSNGIMKTGWLKDTDGTWYNLAPSGEMKTGWLKDTDGNWYYLAPSGAMRTGWLKDTDGNWYNLASSGAMRTGWLKDTDGNWYYLTSSGAMKTGWLKDTDGNWYNLAASGAMRTGWILDTDGKWYFANSSGAMQTGVIEVEGQTYALAEDGAMLSGNIVVAGINYTTDASGAIVGDKPSAQNKIYNNDGVLITAASTFTSVTDNSTLNDEATLGIIGTTATSSTTSAAVAITDGRVAITSESEGTAIITVADDSNHQAKIDVSVASGGAITIEKITKYVAGLDTSAIDTEIAAANSAKKDIVISADGTDVNATSKWVTQDVND